MKEKKPRLRVDKYKSLKKRKRKGFHGINYHDMKKKEVADRLLDLTAGSGTEQQEQVEEDQVETEEVADISRNKIHGKEVVDEEESQGVSPQIHGYKIMDSSVLQGILNCCSMCTFCGAENQLSVRQDDKARRGLCEKLILFCTACEKEIKTFHTSLTLENKLIDINLMSVYAATSSGGGLALLRNFCVSMDFPAPVHGNPYSKYLKTIVKCAMENCEESLSCAAKTLVTQQINDGGTQIAFGVDGTWQKRYGHNSLLGATFVLSIHNGCVLEYSIKSKICHLCEKNPHPTIEWKQKYAAICEINHRGSSGSMEKEGAIEMCVRSVDKHNLKYTTFVGDGDTNSFAAY